MKLTPTFSNIIAPDKLKLYPKLDEHCRYVLDQIGWSLECSILWRLLPQIINNISHVFNGKRRDF